MAYKLKWQSPTASNTTSSLIIPVIFLGPTASGDTFNTHI